MRSAVAKLWLLTATIAIMMISCQVACAAEQAAEMIPGILKVKKQLLARRLLASALVHTPIPTGKAVSWDTSATLSGENAADAIDQAVDSMGASTDAAAAAGAAGVEASSLFQSDQGNRKLLNIPTLPRPSTV
jgi:hypothetical protein